MIRKNLTVKSHADGLPLSVIIVEPDMAPKGIVQILHGMSENKERYLDFMTYLASQGFVCIIHDHRGHGASVYSKDDLGYMYAHGARSIVEDANQISRLIRKRYRELPIFLMGHSMGSLVARVYVKRYDRVLDGLILIGSPSYNPACKGAYFAAKIAGKLFGDKSSGAFFHRLAFGASKLRFPHAVSKNAWICTDKHVIEEYEKDDLCGFIFTVNGFENLFKLMMTVYDKHHWNMNHPKMPIWFISGSDDTCMISHKDFLKAVNAMKQVGYKDVKYTIYKGMRHEVLNDKDHKKVYHDIATKLEIWLNRGNYGAVRRK